MKQLDEDRITGIIRKHKDKWERNAWRKGIITGALGAFTADALWRIFT